MTRVAAVAIAVLLSGCSTQGTGDWMPGERQLAERNPELLQCDSGQPVCRASGGRYRRSLDLCRCMP